MRIFRFDLRSSAFLATFFVAGLLLIIPGWQVRADGFTNAVESFENGMTGWTIENAGVWAVGKPTVGPKNAFDGTKCLGTGMTRNAPDSQSSRLISPVFLLPAA